METTSEPSGRPVQWGVVALLAVIVIAALFSLALALFNLAQCLALFVQGDSAGATSGLIAAAGSLARVLLLAPAAYYAMARLVNHRPRHLPSERVPSWLIIVCWVLAVGIGALVTKFNFALPLFMPPLSVAATLLPIWLIVRVALRRLDTGTDLRRWGSLSLGTTVGPLLSTVLEAAFLVALVLIAVLVVVSDPGLRSMLLQLAERVQSAPTDQAIVRALLPLATNRRFAVVVILTLCIVTPIIEEALKPVAVWFGATRIIAPAQGFALGALCGAGFATFESLMAVATVGSDWWKLVVLRAGTDVMHTANAALMGWALVAAWRERRYLRLALVYAAVIFIHGSWNLLAISYGLSTLPTAVEGITINLNFQASYALPGLALISILMLALLFYMNRRLSRPAYSRLTETEDPSAGHNLQV